MPGTAGAGHTGLALAEALRLEIDTGMPTGQRRGHRQRTQRLRFLL